MAVCFMLCGNPAPRSLGFRPDCDQVYQVSLQQLLTSVKPQLSMVTALSQRAREVHFGRL
jgi:hypothetical protein